MFNFTTDQKSDEHIWLFASKLIGADGSVSILTTHPRMNYLKRIASIGAVPQKNILLVTDSPEEAYKISEESEFKVVVENDAGIIAREHSKEFHIIDLGFDQSVSLSTSLSNSTQAVVLGGKDDTFIKIEVPDFTNKRSDQIYGLLKELKDLISTTDNVGKMTKFVHIFSEIKAPWAKAFETQKLAEKMIEQGSEVPKDMSDSITSSSEEDLVRVAKVITLAGNLVTEYHKNNRAFHVIGMYFDTSSGNDRFGVYGRCKKFIMNNKKDFLRSQEFLGSGGLAPALIIWQ